MRAAAAALRRAVARPPPGMATAGGVTAAHTRRLAANTARATQEAMTESDPRKVGVEMVESSTCALVTPCAERLFDCALDGETAHPHPPPVP
jgi:hypothetical protein